jgi:hypothetical protein
VDAEPTVNCGVDPAFEPCWLVRACVTGIVLVEAAASVVVVVAVWSPGISAPGNEPLCASQGGRGRSKRSNAVGKGIGTATRKLREFGICWGSTDVVIHPIGRPSCLNCSDDVTRSCAAPLGAGVVAQDIECALGAIPIR